MDIFSCCILYSLLFVLQSLRIQQLDVVCETKTKDNVFVQVRIAVQYRVLLESAYDAYYRLSDPRGQIQSYVFDVVRSTVPRMDLDEAFASKQDIADATLAQLKDVMQDYGYEIITTLVTDLAPDSKVKASMNGESIDLTWTVLFFVMFLVSNHSFLFLFYPFSLDVHRNQR